MNVKFVSITPDAEKTMAYIARVSNPSNQENEKYAGLLKYCIKHNHWSVFEQSSMTLEIETTRGLAAQILRHRSFTYQEFSQRYADTKLLDDKIPLPKLRKQDLKNRQNSTDDLDEFLIQDFELEMEKLLDTEITNDRFIEIMDTVLPIPEPTTENVKAVTRIGNIRGEINSLFNNPEFDTQKNTAWALINATSNYEQWKASIRGKSSRSEKLAQKTLTGTENPITNRVHQLVGN